jgi:hypothetical protein
LPYRAARVLAVRLARRRLPRGVGVGAFVYVTSALRTRGGDSGTSGRAREESFLAPTSFPVNGLVSGIPLWVNQTPLLVNSCRPIFNVSGMDTYEVHVGLPFTSGISFGGFGINATQLPSGTDVFDR